MKAPPREAKLLDGTGGLELRVCDDAASLAEAGASAVAARAAEAVARRGRFTLALSGGGTPIGMYAALARRRAASEAAPWRKTHVFWADERVVPPGDPESNFGAASAALLSKVPIPEGNVHRVRTESHAPEAAAALYEEELRGFFGAAEGAFPRFDLVLLGLGADGHTASLFPGSDALREQARLVVAPLVAALGAYRITLTLPVLNSARAVLFLVSGGAKAETLAAVLGRGSTAAPLPARLVRPPEGTVTFLVDQAAASRLPAGTPPGRRGGPGPS